MQMNTPAATLSLAPLIPVYGDGLCQAVNLPPSTTILKGTVLGQVTTAVNDVQTLTAGAATGGTYTLTVNNPVGNAQTTTPLAFNANAAAQQTALLALSNVGAGNLVVSGAGPFVYTFGGTLAGRPIPLITVNGALLTGGSAHTIAHTTTGVMVGVFKAYATGNGDGSQVPKAIAKYDMTTDAAGDIAYSISASSGEWGQTTRSAPVYFKGIFKCEQLIGLDAGAVTIMGHLWNGSITTGIFELE